VVIDPRSRGEDTVIEPGVQRSAKRKIGMRSTIETGSVLTRRDSGRRRTIEPLLCGAKPPRRPRDHRPLRAPSPNNQSESDSRIGNFVYRFFVSRDTRGGIACALADSALLQLNEIADARISLSDDCSGEARAKVPDDHVVVRGGI